MNTPLMQQYHSIKRHYENAILLFRMGDFYETFNDDAIKISKELDITLTSRDKNKDNTPLAGFPYHAMDTYLPKLLGAGLTVAIAEQIEDPKLAKGVVERKVVQVITPGTVYHSNVLKQDKGNYMVALWENKNNFGLVVLEFSTGELLVTEISGWENTLNEINKFNPSEIVVSDKQIFNFPTTYIVHPVAEREFFANNDYRLETKFRVHNVNGLGLTDYPLVQKSLSALLKYIEENQFLLPSHLQTPRVYNIYDTMILDSQTVNNLELNTRLFETLNETQTGMGARLLRYSILNPLLNHKEILERQQRVKYFVNNFEKLNIAELLKRVSDIERLFGRIGMYRATPRDVSALGMGLSLVVDINSTCKNYPDAMSPKIVAEITKVTELIKNTLIDIPPANINGGRYIKPDADPEVKRLSDIILNSSLFLKNYEKEEQARTGISSLKVTFNKVWGYYLEVTNTHLEKIPSDYVHKQTLTNATRFITSTLKEFENDIFSAEEKIVIKEREIFNKLLTDIINYKKAIKEAIKYISFLDLYNSFSLVATKRGYTCPKVSAMTEGKKLLNIKNGRHPVLDLTLGSSFIPNSTTITEQSFVHIITGPNMSGKSTYIRQVALISLLAQMGSFVPADECELTVVDRIFTRIGAGDDISSGRSTFMVEMSEVSTILRNATEFSLLILDEIGRGTSTYDGLSIAWAVTEHIAQKINARTLFATHYHELTDLSDIYSSISNYNVLVKEDETERKVVFLHSIGKGSASKSYGVHVADMAGLPSKVITRAKEVLSNFEKESIIKPIRPNIKSETKDNSQQQSLFSGVSDERIKQYENLRAMLSEVSLDETTPLKALSILSEIIKRVK
ncbi:DNA mismatch repair protein MutS [Candidatus Dojkabacteria bacterium]|nr:DNA mismatch repair protein MutS [Candidatus Dojkabacteria bacterium]